MKERRKETGITLVSLVVTIVVILILSGITISTVFSDNGIIKKAQEVANKTEESIRQDQEELNSLLNQLDDVMNETGGSSVPVTGNINSKITWSTGSATLELTTSISNIYNVQIQYKKNSASSWQDYTSPITSLLHGDTIYAQGILDGEIVIQETEINILDQTPPTVTIASSSSTTNSVSVEATATDNEAGMGSSPQYIFYIKKTIEADSSYTEIGRGSSASITESGLEQNTQYTVKVEVADVAGNTGEATEEITTGEIGGATGGLLDGNIIASNPTWQNGTASVTLSTNTGLSIQWQINGTDDNSWTTSNTATGLEHNDTLYARLTDGTNYGDEANVQILDREAPQVIVSPEGTTTNSVTVSVSSQDNQWGMPSSPTYSYYIKRSEDGSYPNTADYTGTNTSHTFDGLTQGTSYDVRVTTVDKANNTGTGDLQNQTTGTIGGATGGLLEGNIIASNPTWQNGQASVTLSTNTGLSIQWQINGIDEGNWTTSNTATGLEHNDTLYARLTDGNNYGDEANVQILDREAPQVTVSPEGTTTNSVTVSVSSQDNQWGMPSSPTYSYYIKRSTDGNYPSSADYTGTSTRHTFDGLTQGTSYDVRVTVADKAGNTGTGNLANQTTGTVGGATGGLIEGNIIASNPTWSNGQASVTLSTNTGLSIQWQINGIDEGNWITSNTATGLEHNDTLYARLTDGNNYGDEANVQILDREAPQVTVTARGTTTNSVTISVSSQDNQWGMPSSPTYSYYIKRSQDGTYPTTADYTGTSTSHTFDGLTQGTSYDVRVTVADKAGNTGTGNLQNQTTGTIGGATGGLIEGNIIASNPTWSNGQASVTLSTNTGLSIQWQINGIDEGNWTTSNTATGLEHNDTLYARLTDGNNYGDEASVSILDTEAPEITVTTTETTNSITVNVTASDGESGLATSGTYKYYLNNNLEETTTNNSYTFSGLTDDTQYTIKVEVIDKANNVATDIRPITTLAHTIERTLVAGDYVTYVDGTGVSRDCVVLYDSSSEYGVQIITMETVESVTLGRNDTTVSGSDSFTKAKNSYNNAISTLNNATSKYLNTDYASDVRSVGSVPNNPSYDEAGMFTSSYSYMSSYNGQFKNTDTNYQTDWNQMKALTIHNIEVGYWVASRYVSSYLSDSYFAVRIVRTSGGLSSNTLCHMYSSSDPYSYSDSYGLRPVFTLKSGIKVTGGSGTAEDPYTLGM